MEFCLWPYSGLLVGGRELMEKANDEIRTSNAEGMTKWRKLHAA
jgi:hypothetical protein